MKQVLRYSALFGPTQIDYDFFVGSCELTEQQVSALESAIICGWVQYYELENANAVTLHPLISDVFCNELKPDIEHCQELVIFAGAVAESIDEFDSEQRKLHILWLDHLAHNIHGKEMSIPFLLDYMNLIYLTEKDYKNAEWCNKTSIQMIYDLHEEEHFKPQLVRPKSIF